MDRGVWVFFQNCHLAPSWMPTLERLFEQIDKDRLTSMPTPDFPVYILQNGSKITVEPPKGLKANLLRTYQSINDAYLANVPVKNDVFMHLFLSLAFFHSILIERKKFGPLGFNIPYEFTTGDLRICMDQLIMFLTEYTYYALQGKQVQKPIVLFLSCKLKKKQKTNNFSLSTR
ncbi:unnamed protein product [Trichobilharzia regenti]|nr:unnamed protein product [Trichobilharzia regenti]